MVYKKLKITLSDSKKLLSHKTYCQVEYTGTDGEWESSGVLADVYACDGLLVACSPFNQRPMYIASTLNNLISRLKEETRCENIEIK